MGNSYIDKVNQRETGTSDGKQLYPDRIDRIFNVSEDFSVINDPTAQRQIEVYHYNHNDVVTQNPRVELS